MTADKETPSEALTSAIELLSDSERRLRAVPRYESSWDRLSGIIDEAFGLQPVMSHEEMLSFLERKLDEERRRKREAMVELERMKKTVLDRDLCSFTSKNGGTWMSSALATDIRSTIDLLDGRRQPSPWHVKDGEAGEFPARKAGG